MDQDQINYPKLIDQAMQRIVKEALFITSNNKLPGNHHFFISFLTFHPEVILSKKLKKRYPEEMTIVIQHQFENLEVENDFFSVSLSFDGVKEKIVIPFDSLTAFADPSVKFGLQFKHSSEEELVNISTPDIKLKKADLEKQEVINNIGGSNVISIESFRKKI